MKPSFLNSAPPHFLCELLAGVERDETVKQIHIFGVCCMGKYRTECSRIPKFDIERAGNSSTTLFAPQIPLAN